LNKFFINSLLFGLISFGLSSAVADVTYYFSTQEKDQKIRHWSIAFKGQNMLTSAGTADKYRIIYFGKEKLFYVLNDVDKIYYRVDQKIVKQVNETITKLKGFLGNKAKLGKNETSSPVMVKDIEIIKTDKKLNVLEKECDIFELKINTEISGEICLIAFQKLLLKKTDGELFFKTLEEVYQMVAQTPFLSLPLPPFSKLPKEAFFLQYQSLDQSQKTEPGAKNVSPVKDTTTLLRFEPTKLKNQDFVIPKDYQERSLLKAQSEFN
jgi:hypothetical protein